MFKKTEYKKMSSTIDILKHGTIVELANNLFYFIAEIEDKKILIPEHDWEDIILSECYNDNFEHNKSHRYRIVKIYKKVKFKDFLSKSYKKELVQRIYYTQREHKIFNSIKISEEMYAIRNNNKLILVTNIETKNIIKNKYTINPSDVYAVYELCDSDFIDIGNTPILFERP